MDSDDEKAIFSNRDIVQVSFDVCDICCFLRRPGALRKDEEGLWGRA